jgi:hypothetical protein
VTLFAGKNMALTIPAATFVAETIAVTFVDVTIIAPHLSLFLLSTNIFIYTDIHLSMCICLSIYFGMHVRTHRHMSLRMVPHIFYHLVNYDRTRWNL